MIVGLTWAVLMFLFATYGLRSEEEMQELKKNRQRFKHITLKKEYKSYD